METSSDRKSFQLGYWIATHKPALRRAHIATWMIINTLIWAFLFVQLFNWVTHIQQTNDIWKTISTSNVLWSSRVSPQEIQVQRISTVRYDERSIDILVELYNPNAIWAGAVVPYTLTVGGIPVEESEIAIAPLQQRYITRLRLPNTADALPASRITLGKVTWKKMADAAKILPNQSWMFTNAAFHEISGDAAKAFRTELSFEVVNKSVYGFRQVEAVLAMQDGQGHVTALNSVVIDTILTKESRQVILRWPSDINRTNTPKLYMDLDLLDDALVIRTLQ